MTRSVPLWTGATDDTPIPPRVRLRVFEAFGGRCALSGKKIMPGDAWDVDHRIALALGGRNAEDNLQPVLHDKHKLKTVQDVAIKAKLERIRLRNAGIKPKRSGLSHPRLKRRFDGSVVPR